MSVLTIRENNLLEKLLETNNTKDRNPHENISMVETQNNIVKQMKLMRLMNHEVNSILSIEGYSNKFDAFQVDEEDFETKVVRVGVGEKDNFI